MGGRGPRGGKELEEPEKALCWGRIPLKATAKVGADRVWGGTQGRRQGPGPRGARGEAGPARAGLSAKQNPRSQKFSFRTGRGAGPVVLALRCPPPRLISEQAAWGSRIPARALLSLALRPHTFGKQPTVDPGGRGRPLPVPPPPRDPRVLAGGAWVSPAARVQRRPPFAWLGSGPQGRAANLPPPLPQHPGL